MLPKYEHFKFEVGQFVLSAFCRVSSKKRSSSEVAQDAFQIIERVYQECPGGVQLHYVCRCLGLFANREQLIRFNEIELMALPGENDK